MGETDKPEEVRTEKSGSLTGVARYIAHKRIVSRRELHKLFTSQAVRTALSYLRLYDAVYEDGEIVVSVPWLLYLRLVYGDEWVNKARRFAEVLDDKRLSVLVRELDKLLNTPWVGIVRDSLEASKIALIIEELGEKIRRELVDRTGCSNYVDYIAWLISIYSSTLAYLMSLRKASRRHMYVSLKRQLQTLAKHTCVGEEDIYCLITKALLNILDIAGSYLKEGYISTFARLRDYYDKRLYGLKEQTRRNAHSTISSFYKATISELMFSPQKPAR